MADTAEGARTNDLYEVDFYEWTQEQARLLRDRRFEDLDLENLIDEVQSVGSSERREIRNRLAVLLAHLLKWRFQPGLRGPSWRATIAEQRSTLADIVETSPSLRTYLLEQVEQRYVAGRLDAAKQTRIAFGVFPETCPFTAEQIFDSDFFPEEPSFE